MFSHDPIFCYNSDELDDYDFGYHQRSINYHRVKITGFPYFNLADVQRIYRVLNGNSKGWSEFSKKAKLIATEITSNYSIGKCMFKDENALFELLNEKFSERFRILKITCWNELVQYIS